MTPDRKLQAGAVTAVVVTHNSARHMEELAQALSTGSVVPTRMLAVDNLSNDETVQRAEDAGFEVIETGDNRGFGAGCNVALRALDTELVLFCNPDVRPSHGALECLLAALAKAPTAAVAGAALDGDTRPRRFSRITTNIAGFFSDDALDLLRRLRGGRASEDGEDRPMAGEDHLVVDYAVGACILCRVAPLLSVEGFDEDFFLYFEEEDLSRRLAQQGWQTLLVPRARVAHEQRGSSEGNGAALMAAFFTHSMYLYYRKHCSRRYAELARLVIALCVTGDRVYRAIARQPQRYGRMAATAPFRRAESIRR
jgi:N-acetylglucosaminyl-diphospho-decaprenol L-rhamnosyltransferase